LSILTEVKKALSFIWSSAHAGLLAAYPSRLAEANQARNFAGILSPKRQNANRDVCGISTHKVYPPERLLDPTVRSYRTFSPLSRLATGRLFSATLAVNDRLPKPRQSGP